MEIVKIKNYRKFANELAEKTKLTVTPQEIESNHIHYHFKKDFTTILVVCIKNEKVTFLPFDKEIRQDNTWLSIDNLLYLDELKIVLDVIKSLFIED